MYLYEAEVSLLNRGRAKTCYEILNRSHRYCSIEPSVQEKPLFSRVEANPFLLPGDLCGPSRTSGYPQCARFVKGWDGQRWMNGYADCWTRDANIISYIDELVPRERFRGANDDFAFIARRCIVRRVKKVFIFFSNNNNNNKSNDGKISKQRLFEPLPLVLGKNGIDVQSIDEIAPLCRDTFNSDIYVCTRARPRTVTREEVKLTSEAWCTERSLLQEGYANS